MKIKLNNLDINYEVHGSGKPLVLLHGWGSNIGNFKPVINYYKKHFKVIALDFPGFGQSQEPKTPWTVDDYADFTLDFFEALEIEDAIVFGHSFGGRVSINIASRDKHPFEKLVLIDSAGIKPQRTINYYLSIYSYKVCKVLNKIPIIKHLIKGTLKNYLKNSGSSDYQSASSMMKRILTIVVNEDLQHLMPKIDVPTLLVWGDLDTATPLKDGLLMESLIKDSGLAVIENTGHYSYLEDQKTFFTIINAYLKDYIEAKEVQ